MCGILGTNFNGSIVDEPEVANSLTHRGPDSSRSYTDGSMGFRISRLAIVNSDFDDQPSFGCNGRYTSILNGEIYNYKSMAYQLRKLGHNIPEDFSDAAILPHMIEEYGYDFVTKIDGMFAIAIWDHDLNELVIYRDSIGIKPIYYKISDSQIFFASEIHAINVMSNQANEIDQRAIENFSEQNLISSPRTAYENIYSLIPGTYLRIKEKDMEIKRWHHFEPNRKTVQISIIDSVTKLEELLISSISDQLNHGISNAILLSGGLDSSLIAAIAKKKLNRNLDCYHLSYESDIESKQKETIVARDVAKQLGLDFSEYRISSKEYFEHIDQALNAFSQPFGGVTSTYFISKFISQEHKVCLTGDGADELFGSYRKIQQAASLYYDSKGSDKINQSDKTTTLSDFMNHKVLPKVINQNQELFYPIEEEIQRFKAETNIFDFTLLESQLRLLPDQVLLFSDHLGMAHGLEIRPPYLSKGIIKFSRELPLEHLIDSKGTTKYVLKELALKYFDKDFVHRKKEGFMLPLETWLKKEEATKWVTAKLNEYLDSNDVILNRQKVQQFIEDYEEKRNNDFFRIYRLAVLMHYLKKNAK